MLKRISILFVICLAAFTASAQTEKYTAPVKWERYAVSEKNVSVLFPKLPILIENNDVCAETEKREYAAYAEGIVYGLNITAQTSKKAPDFCNQINDSRKFDAKSFDDRLTELTTSLKNAKTEKVTRNGLAFVKISDDFFAYWLTNDFKNKRWFEVWTTDQDEANLKIKNFVESIKIGKKSAGIEIEKGAGRTLGDEITKVSEETTNNSPETGTVRNIRIILKTRPAYTDAARANQIQGTVRLKVTFLNNGGIGSITPVDTQNFGLSIYGLTEQAIMAAKKIVFVPARKNKTNYTVVKIVEYGFSIY